MPLHQDAGDGAVPGTLESPIMICPVCQQEYRATGMTCLIPIDVKDMTDEAIEKLAEVVYEQMLEVARRHSRPVGG